MARNNFITCVYKQLLHEGKITRVLGGIKGERTIRMEIHIL